MKIQADRGEAVGEQAPSRRRRLSVLSALLGVALFLISWMVMASPTQAQGASITVNTNADEANTDGDCSLREAIIAANTNATVDACAAGSGTEEDAIGFDLGSSATITLGSQLPNITDAAGLAIDGGEADLAIDGSDDDGFVRAFWVDSDAKLALHNLMVTHARVVNGSGGAIYNDGGELKVIESTFFENTAGEFGGGGGGAIYNNGGEVTVSDSTFSGNATFGVSSSIRVEGGGAIHNTSGTLTVSDSTFSGNETVDVNSFGGGILDEGGLVTVTNSTFVGNRAGFVGGGGGIAFWETPLGAEFGEHHRVTNSTFTGNVADEGSNIYCATTPSQDCGLGADDFPDVVPHLRLRNTIVANSATAALNCNFLQASDGGYNISDDDSCGFQAARDSLSNTDPLLDPNGLQDNGGPTKTVALQGDSPAIDAIPEGANGCATEVTQDQRGELRPQDGDNDGTPSCDIGAFEVPEGQETTAPDPPAITSPPEGSYDKDGSFTLSGTAEPNSTVELFDGGEPLNIDTTVDASGNWSVELTGVSEGSHSYTAKATDQAGHVSAESQARTVIVDTIKPSVTSVTPAELATGVTPGANVTVAFSEKMNASTLTGETFLLYEKKATKPIAATVSYDPATNESILDPSADLKGGVAYTAMVTTGATDLAGHACVVKQVWDFTVKK